MKKQVIIIIILLLIIKNRNNIIFKLIKEKRQYSIDFYKDETDKKVALRKGQIYFQNCLNDRLINKKIYQKNSEPLVSVIIPVYNAELKIKKAIISIQNQKISNLEIILVNDYSTDNTLDIINNFRKTDKRIILLENKKNKGIFYTRCIGTLKAEGKFIFPLDNDDLFFDEGVIDSIVNEAIKDKLDIVEFNYAEYFNLTIPPDSLITSEFGNHTHNLIIKQPKLRQFPRKRNNSYGTYDCYVWGKCIDTNIYKKSIKMIGRRLYSKYILRGEDFIMTFVLFRIANSFKFFSRYGIFRYKNNSTATFQSSKELYILSRIIYLDVIIKFTEKKYDDNLYIVFFSKKFLPLVSKNFINMKNQNKIFFKIVFHKLLNNKFIKKENKKKFISYFKNYSWVSKFI